MSYRISLRLAVAILTGAALFPLIALGQSQDQPSVADAARRAREQKKAAAKQPSPVITDDTLKRSAPSGQDSSASTAPQPSEPTPAGATGSAAASQASPDAAGAPNGNADQKTQVSAELAALKQQVEEEQKNLELVQRELSLQQDTYFSNPDHARDTAGKAKLDGTQQQVADKQQEVNALKAQLATLLGSSGNTPPTPPATPPQP